MWKLLIAIIVLGVGAAALWVNAGRAPGPTIEIGGPEVIGQTGEISVTVTAPNGALTDFQVRLAQDTLQHARLRTDAGNGERAQARWRPRHGHAPRRQTGDTGAQARRRKGHGVGGAARCCSAFARPTPTATRDITVRLNPPQIAVLSQFHYVNHGGSEMVVYRVTPPDSESGVRVGDYEYRGFPASGAGIPANDPGLRVAFFALLWDQTGEYADLGVRARLDRQRRPRQRSTTACSTSNFARAR